MIDKVRVALCRYGMVKQGDRVAVALSGGCDSVALLYALNALKDELGITLSAVHINHNLRGEESDRDEAFARKLCQHLGIELEVFSVDVLAEQERSGESTELCARRLRYACFDRLVESGCKVATAHTMSDNAETVLFNLARGSGIKGMCGIPPVRDAYIRPLIMCTREDNESYCKSIGADFVTDSSNLTDDYSRNFIRHHIVPEMKKLNPSFDSAVMRMSSRLAEIETAISRAAEQAVEDSTDESGYRCDRLLSLDYHIMSAAVRLITLRETGLAADSLHTDELCAAIATGGRVQLDAGIIAECGEHLTFIGDKPEFEAFCIDLHEGEIDTPIYKLNIKITTEKSQFVNKFLTRHAIDYDKIIGKAVISNRESGDEPRLKGRPTKLLRKLMNELNIPAYLREAYPVIRDDAGLIYAVGIGVAERVSVDKSTKKMIIISEEGK